MTIAAICVVGLGYIGLPTAAILANHGVKVVGVDIDQSVVDTINNGCIHIVEPSLSEIVKVVVSKGMLRAATKPEPAEAFLIAVPTPFKGNFEPDMAYVEAATRAIAPMLKSGDIIILESTSPVGSTGQMATMLAEIRPDLSFPQQVGETADVSLAYCPERVLPGRIVYELIENDRIIGGMTPRCASKAATVYQHFVRGKCLLTDARTAEMCKLTENAFRDVNIAFANELSLICDHLDIDVWELIRLANHHPRVNILHPGPGVGGHCIAVDPWFIVYSSPEQARLIRLARKVNDDKPAFVVNKVIEAVAGIRNPIIACLGLAFKANIDDLRESPAVHIVEDIIARRLGQVLVVEPYITELPAKLMKKDVELTTVENAISRADVVVVLVNHVLFEAYAGCVTEKRVIDTRGMWSV